MVVLQSRSRFFFCFNTFILRDVCVAIFETNENDDSLSGSNMMEEENHSNIMELVAKNDVLKHHS